MRFRKAVEEVILDHVHEIRRVIIILPARHHVERRSLSLLNLLRLDEAVLLHLVQHAIARFGGSFRTAIGRGVAIGGADNAGKKGGFVDGVRDEKPGESLLGE